MQSFKTLPLLCFFLLNNVVLHHAQQAQLHGTFETKFTGGTCEFNNPSGKACEEREFTQIWVEPHLMYDPGYQRERQELLDEINEASAYMSKISDELNNNKIVVVRTLTGTLKYPLDEDQGSKVSGNNSFDMVEMGVYPLVYPAIENKHSFDDAKCPAELKNSQSLKEILSPTCPSANLTKKRKRLPSNIYSTQKTNNTEAQRFISQPLLRRAL